MRWGSFFRQAEAGANVAIWYNSNKKAVEEAAAIEKAYGVKCASRRSVLETLSSAAADNHRHRQSVSSGRYLLRFSSR